jgi:DNA-directed RNA polymerase specialized sigma24 family protein
LKWADRARRFRPYLKQALRNYAISIRRKRSAEKRIPEQMMDRPDAEESTGWEQIDVRQQAEAEAAFHDAWVRELLKTALERFEKACQEAVKHLASQAAGQRQPWERHFRKQRRRCC